MTAQQLKNSILQMAVQGKLVRQDPNDEPASALLDRIRAEKEEMVKEGKIKKEKNPAVIFRGDDGLFYEKIGDQTPVCIEDELPFVIPESWEWARLGDIFLIEMGQSPKSEYVSELQTGFEFHQGKVFFGDKYLIKSNQTTSKPTKIAPSNSVLLCVRAPVGKVNITDREICIGRGLCSIAPLANMSIDFVYYLLATYEDIFVKQATGTTFIAITGTVVKNQLVPLPPLKEQYRIVERIKTITPILLQYEKSETRLENINKFFPNQLKKSILQFAVQGKLVPQDASDEPASVLLERIRAEKEQLIESGKIKRDKHESVIYRRDDSYYEKVDGVERCIDDEVPFDIPESWELIRLKDIGEYRKGPFGSSLTKSIFVPKSSSSIKVYEQKNAIKKDATLGTYYITEDYFIHNMQSFEVLPGDVIVSCAGTIGETFVLPSNIERGIINQALMRMRIFTSINLDYFLLYFDYVLKGIAKSSSKGSAIKNIPPFNIFKQLLLPLPPLAEQERIVEKLSSINEKIKCL